MKKSVSLVLSSGGARGLAHIGVIEELINNDYEITSIAGSSMGALIGGFYAAGKLEIFKQWVCDLDRMDVFKLIDLTFSKQGLIRGDRVFNVLGKIIEDCNIENLPIDYCAVATDLLNKNEVVFRSGSLYNAIRASIAIPTVFKPYNYNGTKLVDGGVLNPVPVGLASKKNGDLVVVSNVNAPIDYCRQNKSKKEEAAAEMAYKVKLMNFWSKFEKIFPKNEDQPIEMGFVNLLSNSIDLMQDKLTQILLELNPPDLLINVSRNACGIFEFYKAEELIEEGRRATKEKMKLIADSPPSRSPCKV